MVAMRKIDEQVLDAIRTMRAEHHAATAGRIALNLKVSKQYVVQSCERLKSLGLVDWTPNFAGSLHVVNDESGGEDLLPTSVSPSRPVAGRRTSRQSATTPVDHLE